MAESLTAIARLQQMATAKPEAYGGIACHIQEDRLLQQLVRGEVRVPDIERSLLSVFPPALIPLWATGARTIIGLWKHWLSDRQPTFVEYYGTTVYGRRRMVFEHGRSLKQVIYRHLFDCITNRDGVDDELRRFAKLCGIGDVDEIDRLSVAATDVTALRSHPEFAGRLPLSFFDCNAQNGYTGDFPTRRVTASADKLQQCCVYEVHSGFRNLEPDYSLRESVFQDVNAPPWFRTSSQHDVFWRLLKSDDLPGAWMCLNSPEWTLADARQALAELANRVAAPLFLELVSAWAHLPFADDDTL